MVPSVYLCYVNLIALRERIWQINESTSLGVFPVDKLPLEKVVFIFLTNIIVTLGSHAFDKSQAVIDTYCLEPFPVGSNISMKKLFFGLIRKLLEGSVCNEQNLDPSVIADIETSIVVLNSSSFSLASNLFPNDVKQDITILYAFCSITDDMIDNEHSVESRREQIEIIVKFLDQLFYNRKVTSEYCWETTSSAPKIDWPYFEKKLSNEQMCSFRATSRIAYYLPQEPFYELVRGYKWDIEGRSVTNEQDLIEYSKCVASSIGALLTFVFCHKSYRWPDEMGPKTRRMIENGRKMGVVLQLCNISRDIIIDSETLGRCYVPNNYFREDELKYLVNDRDPHKIPNAQLKRFAERMMDIADDLSNSATGALINSLPSECQRAYLTALEIYQGIGKLIRSNTHYQRRATVPKFGKIRIALKCLYFTSMASLYERETK